MAELAGELSGIQVELAKQIVRFGVPGASLAVWRDGEEAHFAAGLLNVETGVEATPSSVFQIGSITKLFTGTLIMQLVDDGRIELDAPVRNYLPRFAVADAEATEAITVRHLLTHTSGIDGDFFLDTGRGDDCVERYLLACSALPQLHAPGDGWSYCNAGFVILGRIVEQLTGLTWDEALRRRLTGPIGASTLVTLPEHALVLRAAAGHFAPPDTPPRVVRAGLPRSNGPAGATPYGATSDLFKFARMHLDGGMAADGTQVLSEESVRRMQEVQHTFDAGADPARFGLAWMLFDWGGERVIGHDGGTIGQASYLRILPSRRLAVALLTNGGRAAALYRQIFNLLFERLAGLSIPLRPEPQPITVDGPRYAGLYKKLSASMEVTEGTEGLTVTSRQLKGLVPGTPPMVAPLRPVDERRFLAVWPAGLEPQVLTFDRFDAEGRPTRLNAGRMFLRVR